MRLDGDFLSVIFGLLGFRTPSCQPPESLAAVSWAANRYTAIRISRNSHKTNLILNF